MSLPLCEVSWFGALYDDDYEFLSGYPHAVEAELFARHVLPHLEHGPLAVLGPGTSTTGYFPNV